MEEIILRAKNGDESAVEQLFLCYKPLVRAYANKFYLVGGDKDDLLQEGMIGLFYAIATTKQREVFPLSWSCACCDRYWTPSSTTTA